MHLKNAKDFIEKIITGVKNEDLLFWVIEIKEKQRFAGTICLWHFSEDRKTAELGYELMPAFHGNGIMNEAGECIIRYGFQVLRLQQVEAFTHKDNTPSINLLEKHQFTRDSLRHDPANKDNIIY